MNKILKRGFFLLALLFLNIQTFAQSRMPEVEMADALRANGKIYVVVIIACIVFAGIAAYLIHLDRKIGKLEKEAE